MFEPGLGPRRYEFMRSENFDPCSWYGEPGHSKALCQECQEREVREERKVAMNAREAEDWLSNNLLIMAACKAEVKLHKARAFQRGRVAANPCATDRDIADADGSNVLAVKLGFPAICMDARKVKAHVMKSGFAAHFEPVAGIARLCKAVISLWETASEHRVQRTAALLEGDVDEETRRLVEQHGLDPWQWPSADKRLADPIVTMDPEGLLETLFQLHGHVERRFGQSASGA